MWSFIMRGAAAIVRFVKKGVAAIRRLRERVESGAAACAPLLRLLPTRAQQGIAAALALVLWAEEALGKLVDVFDVPTPATS